MAKLFWDSWDDLFCTPQGSGLESSCGIREQGVSFGIRCVEKGGNLRRTKTEACSSKTDPLI